MRPITVSVGPLAAALATAIVSNAGAFSGGQLYLNGGGPVGGSIASAFVGAATLAGVTMTITSATSGRVTAGMRLNGKGLAPNTVVIGPAPGSVGAGVGSAWIINPPSLAPPGAYNLRGNPVFIMDAPRQIVITNTELAGRAFTVQGFDAAGTPISETLPTNGATLTTQQNFAQVTEVDYTPGGAALGAITVGTGPATSPWVNFDPWAHAQISEQVDVIGTANYTVQISNDDPNSPTNPTPPGLMTWLPDPNVALVGASTPQFASWSFIPLYARILLNSGAGSVSGTFVQADVVSR